MVGQAKLMPEYFNYYAGLAQLPTGSTNPLHVKDMLNYTVRDPLGVVAAIAPWNSPLLLVWKFVERASDNAMRRLEDAVGKLKTAHESGRVVAMLTAKNRC